MEGSLGERLCPPPLPYFNPPYPPTTYNNDNEEGDGGQIQELDILPIVTEVAEGDYEGQAGQDDNRDDTTTTQHGVIQGNSYPPCADLCSANHQQQWASWLIMPRIDQLISRIPTVFSSRVRQENQERDDNRPEETHDVSLRVWVDAMDLSTVSRPKAPQNRNDEDNVGHSQEIPWENRHEDKQSQPLSSNAVDDQVSSPSILWSRKSRSACPCQL